ncbi:uncharacterized protein LAESUDRAFT_759600 [Laetiporus sulphureus 93-53]|uniref:Transmembrane protein n=1 Tax=Laetiporus sulphureus 93-53 TaxID=1314785 RepID=A0A165E1F4_9APHY|nr:uncharacterized protein LAESUDRAFT_759600 [Laetiporus sulphureus 93-53]KZT06063.1 hypothetical protein LAESUDRAFT_759600 [Laetiporus sulphureus 93-53]
MSDILQVFSALRVFAVGHRNFQIASITLVLSLVPVGTNLFSDVRASFSTIDVPGFGIACNAGSDISATTSTIIKKEAVAVNMKASIVTLLLRDGTIYFAVLLVLNVAHLVLSLTNVFLDITFFVTSFVLSSIIISRFLLNLRQVSSTDDESLDGGPSFVRSSPSTVRFPAFVGSMGAPLDHERHSLTISTLTSTDGSECSCMSNESCAHCVEPEDVSGDCKGDELIHLEEESISRSMDGNSEC